MAKAAARKKARTTAVAMIEFSRSRDIPFNRIRLSDSNVREIDVEDGLDELTHDIDHREDLVMGLNVRAILDTEGNETGDFETPAGGRRFRAIARLVEAGRFPADGLVPCLVKKANAKTSAVDDSLAENIVRLALHPLDQFKAFKRMVDDGMSKEEIADAYRTTARYVTQRLRLAAVSPALLEIYARNDMTLAELEAFTVNPDHARQEQVWDRISDSWRREPWQIRKMLTETTVPASDKRARFIGLDAYEAAGGPVLRDLFSDDDSGWLQDVALLDRLVGEKLKVMADEVAEQGWKWIAAAVELPYGHANGLRRIAALTEELTEQEREDREALRSEHDELEAEYRGADELPEEVDQRLSEIETLLSTFENRPTTYDPAEIARAGVFLGIDRDGKLIVDRGYVRPEDEAPVAAETEDGDGETEEDGSSGDEDGSPTQRTAITVGGELVDPEDEDEEDIKPLPDRLISELTAHRTLALQEALANKPHVAMTALLHRLVMQRYHFAAPKGCMEISVGQQYFSAQGADLKDSPSAKARTERSDAWEADFPRDEAALWDWIAALDEVSRMALLAHCVSYGVNALYERPNPQSSSGISQHTLDCRLAAADRLARATGFDMVHDAGWRPTVDNYLGRVTKARILAAVREGAGDRAAQLIEHLKKGDMAKEAERLLAGTGWLPEPLRTPDLDDEEAPADADSDVDALPEFLAGDDEDGTTTAEDHPLAAAE
ncbi:MAG: chromosome partitioning protein ParB [Bosea sp.]|uniref:ParB/RepB/Spo0J family partition protein n=1 Tax=Hyphomicrobiales TaxID=356 RepID=UPI0009E6D1AF|nr:MULTISPECIES: chromosome partitioning protein ParB [Hyphomicrobiales]MCP4561756.1 chromosome partitioning protein ParB [Bosea sp. (in: a-proteobacteria)]MCP4736947.1 chromosome partitioning protein ParB [Bosea sp. (in: a-proteobacteria)]MDX3805062.1 chromosome partitioning protein ParB [Bosea sp. (in: a-proteobacteria)]